MVPEYLGLINMTQKPFSFRSARYVENTSKDKILDDSVIEETLLKVCDAFYDRHFPAAKPTESYEHATNLNVIHETLGFTIEKIESEIPNGGAGVGVMKGKIPKGSLVSLYPGKNTIFAESC